VSDAVDDLEILRKEQTHAACCEMSETIDQQPYPEAI